MPYNETLAEEVKLILKKYPSFKMKKMFGGVCFLLHGNMACGVLNNDLIIRVGPENYEQNLALPETKKFDITGRPMKGWVMVSFDNQQEFDDLEVWVEKGVDFALTLPPK